MKSESTQQQDNLQSLHTGIFSHCCKLGGIERFKIQWLTSDENFFFVNKAMQWF
ncbi:hypothetical protein VCHA49P379_70087 [Vibrio chagasii]|nr:hypothetical protein VCHA36P164_10224 [Vibrio chagasii]CAH7167365.1 hypothetical protein VCHA40P242_20515 [Vibrio chagasii]CAH7391944.1 hypothetical protein VCHA49P379_70087 [Vibrio chagasii]